MCASIPAYADTFDFFRVSSVHTRCHHVLIDCEERTDQMRTITVRVNRRRSILHRTAREPFSDRVRTGRSFVSRRATVLTRWRGVRHPPATKVGLLSLLPSTNGVDDLAFFRRTSTCEPNTAERYGMVCGLPGWFHRPAEHLLSQPGAGSDGLRSSQARRSCCVVPRQGVLEGLRETILTHCR
jgi:hypothetical protein